MAERVSTWQNLCIYDSYVFFIDVWGFDYDAVEVLQKMKPKDDLLSHKFAFLLQQNPSRSPDLVRIILFKNFLFQQNPSRSPDFVRIILNINFLLQQNRAPEITDLIWSDLYIWWCTLFFYKNYMSWKEPCDSY